MTTVLITGASSGIGARAASLFVDAGATVFGAARNTAAIAALDSVTPVSLDLADEASVRAAVAAVEAQAGTIDVLVNCAGYGKFGSVEETTLAEARHPLPTIWSAQRRSFVPSSVPSCSARRR